MTDLQTSRSLSNELPHERTLDSLRSRAIARAILAGNLRVALSVVAACSRANDMAWHRSWLFPDTQTDRRSFERWKARELSCLAQLGQEALEDHGWRNLWDWAVLAGAMTKARATIVQRRLANPLDRQL